MLTFVFTPNMQPDLNGAHFLLLEKEWQKIAGVEGGKAAQNILICFKKR